MDTLLFIIAVKDGDCFPFLREISPFNLDRV